MIGAHRREWSELLSHYVSNELDESERARVEGHLADCAECRELLRDLTHVLAVARRAGDIAPPEDLWERIAARLTEGTPPADEHEPATVIALPTAGVAPVRASGWSRARLAAAAVFLAAISAGSTWWIMSATSGGAVSPAALLPGPADVMLADLSGVPVELADQLRALEGVLQSAEGTLDPATVLVLERSLNTIESAINDAADALATDPGNAFLMEHLERMYRRKLIYLQDAVRVVEWTS